MMYIGSADSIVVKFIWLENCKRVDILIFFQVEAKCVSWMDKAWNETTYLRNYVITVSSDVAFFKQDTSIIFFSLNYDIDFYSH